MADKKSTVKILDGKEEKKRKKKQKQKNLPFGYKTYFKDKINVKKKKTINWEDGRDFFKKNNKHSLSGRVFFLSMRYMQKFPEVFFYKKQKF